MPSFVQMCWVVAAAGFLAFVVTGLVVLVRLGAAVARLSSAAKTSQGQVERIGGEIQELLSAIHEITHPTHPATRPQERLGPFAVRSAAVIDGTGEPVFTTVAIARDAEAGQAHLVDLLARRIAARATSENGDPHHE